MLIHPEPKRVLVAELQTHPENPRRAELAPLIESFDSHGFFGTLVVQASTGRVLVGNHRLMAARELGIESLPCQLIDCDDDEARRILLVDNRASDLASYDNEQLLSLLQELSSTEAELAGTLFTSDDLLALLGEASAEDEPGEEDEEEPGPASFDPFSLDAIAGAAFAHYAEHGWPDLSSPRHMAMAAVNQLRAMPDARLPQTRAGMLILDTYHPQRYGVRANFGTHTPWESFADPERLAGMLRWMLEMGAAISDRNVAHFLGLYHFGQAAANFRPGFMLAMLRRFAPAGACVLDTSAGFGGRLLGFLASDASCYIGIDPAEETHRGNARLAEELAIPGKQIELYPLPAEDVGHELLAERCDVAVTSPPFFDLERYADDAPTQAAVRYPEPEAWRKGFLRPMLELQAAALRPGCFSIINVDIVPSSSGRERQHPHSHDLPAWTIEEAQAVGFELADIERYRYTGGRPGQEDDRGSPVLILRRP